MTEEYIIYETRNPIATAAMYLREEMGFDFETCGNIAHYLDYLNKIDKVYYIFYFSMPVDEQEKWIEDAKDYALYRKMVRLKDRWGR